MQESTDPVQGGVPFGRSHAAAAEPRPSLAKNTWFILLGEALPAVVGLWAVPILVQRLGTDRFGLLVLILAVMGYFGLFDLGLGAALTKLVAEKVRTGESAAIGGLAGTGLAGLLGLGLLGMLAALAVGPWLVRDGLALSGPLGGESLTAFRLLALSVPMVTIAAGLRALLEAHQSFGWLACANLTLGVLSFLAPVFASTYAPGLVSVVAVLVILRMAYCGALTAICLSVVLGSRHRVGWGRDSLHALMSFGAWVSISNLVGALLVYVDRLVIGVLVGRGGRTDSPTAASEVAASG
jgi:O-antigen/teichoic acid export membrane protein